MSFEEHCESSSDCTVGAFIDTQTSELCNKAITPYICDRCGENFQTKASVLSHIKWKHENPNSDFMCSVCQKVFTRKYNFDRHQKNCHHKFLKKKNAVCSLCDFSASNRVDVLTHYKVEHNLYITKKTLNFSTFEEFQIWKQKFEKDTKSRFIKTSGTRHTKGGVNTMKYICHRDGNFQSKSKGIRRMKVIGSNKINSYCPANIVVSETGQTVKVEYIDTHVGHELDLCHLNITESERADIAKKLAMKIPFGQILDDIRDSIANGELERIHLLTRKDLWNIVDSYNLNHEVILYKNNFSSVEDWVSHMQSSSSLVRFYKPQGGISKKFPQLKEEDFFLVIMNDTQKEIFQKFGNDCVCIDNTHSLSASDFQLYTVLVLDDMRQGFPCGFLFSNRADTVALEIFFKTIKDCLYNTVQPKTFMSDMDDTIFNAWSAIMGPVENRLFCSWHVDRAWRRNLSKIKSKEKQAVIYKKIKIIMYEMDLNTFSAMVNNLLDELRSNTDCLEFFEHFETYVKKCASWAFCYRKQSGIKANMNLENLHRVLKHIYYGEKKVKRMDKVIITLMDFIRNNLFDRIRVLNKKEISKKLASIRLIHKKSLGLQSTIINLGDSWNVSATNCDDIYKVEVAKTTCSCNLLCQECKSCIHNYTCNCIDFSINWNMCKHIHLVCLFLKNNIPIDNAPIDGNIPEEEISYEIDHVINDDISDDEEESTVLSVVSTAKQHSFDKRKQDMINKVCEVFKTIQSEEQLEAALEHLASLESVVNVVSKNNIQIPKTWKKPPNRKIKSRMKFSLIKREK